MRIDVEWNTIGSVFYFKQGSSYSSTVTWHSVGFIKMKFSTLYSLLIHWSQVSSINCHKPVGLALLIQFIWFSSNVKRLQNIVEIFRPWFNLKVWLPRSHPAGYSFEMMDRKLVMEVNVLPARNVYPITAGILKLDRSWEIS